SRRVAVESHAFEMSAPSIASTRSQAELRMVSPDAAVLARHARSAAHEAARRFFRSLAHDGAAFENGLRVSSTSKHRPADPRGILRDIAADEDRRSVVARDRAARALDVLTRDLAVDEARRRSSGAVDRPSLRVERIAFAAG